MISKSLKEWHEETLKIADKLYDKYGGKYAAAKFPQNAIEHYALISNNNYRLSECLKHFLMFNAVYSKDCKACRELNPAHIDQISDTYYKYHKLIDFAAKKNTCSPFSKIDKRLNVPENAGSLRSVVTTIY